jgi:uncharacterized protein
MYTRNIIKKISIALEDTPVVLLNGARQTGKSTLAKSLAQNLTNVTYYNLDDITVRAAIQSDISQFVAHNKGLVIIDEVQKIPELFDAIKLAVDNDRRPGRFLLTGSLNIYFLSKMSDSLAGRIEIISLWPLSQGEINNVEENFIDKIFAKNVIPLQKVDNLNRDKFFEHVLRGGYPEVLTRKTKERQYAWFASYVSTILQRDIKDITNIEDVSSLPKLLKLLATRAASLLNHAELSRTSGIPQTTLTRYLTLLQATFLIQVVFPFSNNRGKRLVKTPKVFLNDTGLLAYLLGLDRDALSQDGYFRGILLENFVVMELIKQLTWSKTNPEIFHYRTYAGSEIDIILENRAGNILGIEVKSTSVLTKKDFRNFEILAEDLGSKFLRGIILYTGDKVLPFGKNLYALPANLLWHKF